MKYGLKLEKKDWGKLKIWEPLIFEIVSEMCKISERLMETEAKRHRGRIQELVLPFLI